MYETPPVEKSPASRRIYKDSMPREHNKDLTKEHPSTKEHMFTAILNSSINGWDKKNTEINAVTKEAPGGQILRCFIK